MELGFRQLFIPLGALLVAGLVLSGGASTLAAQTTPAAAAAEGQDLASPGALVVAEARKNVAQGKLDDAIALLNDYTAKHPLDVEPERYLGDLYYRQADLKSAEMVYKRVLAVNPHDRETHNRLGGIYAAEDRVSDAIDEF